MTYKEKVTKFVNEQKAKGVTYSWTLNFLNQGLDEEEAYKQLWTSFQSSYQGEGIPVTEL